MHLLTMTVYKRDYKGKKTIPIGKKTFKCRDGFSLYKTWNVHCKTGKEIRE